MDRITVIDYTLRILMAVVAFGIAFLLITSALSGVLALLALTLLVLLLFCSFIGIKKLKQMF